MINNFKQPNLNAPRYREKVLGLLNAELINEFKNKHPIYSKIDNNSLGYLFIGTCPAAKSVNTDYALSKKYGKVLQNKNWETDGKVAKIFYTNYSTKYRFKNRELWQFIAVRQFKRAVAKSYPKKWRKYITMVNKKKVAHMYKKDK